MAKNISKITINATCKKIWRYLTEPSLVKQWQYGSDLLTDWKIGSDIRFHSEWNGASYDQWGKVLEKIPFRVIKYTLFAPRPGLEDLPENYFIMTYTLEECGGKTILIVTQEDNRPQIEPQNSTNIDQEPSVLESLRILAEGHAIVD